MADVIVCGRCSARSWVGTQFCYVCGGSLTPNDQGVVSPGQPPMPFVPVPPVIPPTPQQFAPSIAPAVRPPAGPVFGGAPNPGGFIAAGPPPTQPWYGAAVPNAAPPPGYSAASSATAAARPTGIVILTVVEILIGLGGLYVANDLLGWAYVSNYYQDSEAMGVELVMGVAYLATVIPTFVIAWGLWSMRPWAWIGACLLAFVLLGFEVIGVIAWGVETTDVLGAITYLSVLAYLSMKSTRALFRRSPTTFMQGAH